MSKYYDFVLTENQLDFIAKSENSNLIVKVLVALINRTCASHDSYYDEKGLAIWIEPGQVVVSESELAELCNCDCETIFNIISELNGVGLITTMPSKRTSVQTLRFFDAVHGLCDWGLYNHFCQKEKLQKENKHEGITDDEKSEIGADNNAESNLSSSGDNYVIHMKHMSMQTEILANIIGKDAEALNDTDNITADTSPDNVTDSTQMHTEIAVKSESDLHDIKDLQLDDINTVEEK